MNNKKDGKRRDNRGRILGNGESQKKDGRYVYKYTDKHGKIKFVYSWRLNPTDTVPKGKRDCISLREKEKSIQKDVLDGISCNKMTVCDLYAKQNSLKQNVKLNTEKGRKHLMNILESDILGAMSIDKVKPSDAKEWAIRMSKKGYGYQTINNYKRSLKASFYTAVEDDLVHSKISN